MVHDAVKRTEHTRTFTTNPKNNNPLFRLERARLAAPATIQSTIAPLAPLQEAKQPCAYMRVIPGGAGGASYHAINGGTESLCEINGDLEKHLKFQSVMYSLYQQTHTSPCNQWRYWKLMRNQRRRRNI